VIPYLCIALFAVIIDVGWVIGVRLVKLNARLQLILVAMSMQAVSNLSTLILVSNSWTMIASAIGAGIGAWIGLKIPESWLQTADPKLP